MPPHLNFLSHAWAQTGYAYQGQTIDHIIAVMPSLSGLTTQKGFYTAISRARHEVTFLTDNIQRIQETLAERTGDRKTAIVLHREKSTAPVPEIKTPEPVRELTRTRTEHVR